VLHQSDLDSPDSAAMGVAWVYHNLCDGLLAHNLGAVALYETLAILPRKMDGGAQCALIRRFI
jgi:hypothetical protein